ncbi:hypothetical protein KDA23_07645 [Candidatus Saccharibacteria bacterium]|nr:hypothetical protein [Candidatus Saccharibacteria bacterium]
MVEYLVRYLGNFSVIFMSMALFFAPFVAVFWWRQRNAIREAGHPHFNYFMERFFMSREANWLIFSWAAAEAIVWFIIPEFLLILLIFMKINRKFDLVKYDLLGTIVGTIIALIITIPQQLFLSLPYIRPKMVQQVTEWYDQQGVLGLVHQPFSGVPYKVFTHVASDYHFFIVAFLVVAVIARMVRYLVVYEATKALYPLLHRYVRKHYAWIFVLAVAIFTGLLLRVVSIYS